MRDLELWRRLIAGTATAAELAPVATWALARRAPLFVWIEPLAQSVDPELRAAAIAALGAARGVPGLQAIVAGLDADDERVRTAAVEAIRATARHAPHRFTHALFHPRADVRRAALAGEPPANTNGIAIHLRADPACADLAKRVVWPDHPLPLAFDLYAGGHVSARELVDLVLAQPVSETRAFAQGRVAQRGPEVIVPFLDDCARTGFVAPPGRDVLDTLLGAIVAAGDFGRPLERFVEIATPKTGRGLTMRGAVSLVGELARAPRPQLVTACVGLEPRALAFPGFQRAWADAAVRGLVEIAPPVWQGRVLLAPLLALPVVREPFDLALAAAIVGLAPQQRLHMLEATFGEDAIVGALVARDRGWAEVCGLPPEKPELDLPWLARIEKLDEHRYVQLCGRAIATYTDKRLDAFIEHMQRRVREQAFLVALTCDPRAERERVAATCRAIAPRVDRTALAGLLRELPAGRVLELVRALSDKQLASAAQLLDDAAAGRLVLALDGPDPPPRDRELALATALAGRASPTIREWIKRVMPPDEPRFLVTAPAVRTRRALTTSEIHAIATCVWHELPRALAPALRSPVTGLCTALSRRPAAASASACAALLGSADPLDDVAQQLQRFGAEGAAFDADLDNACAAAWLRVHELPPLAHARLWRWEQHELALADWVENAGGVIAALGAIQTVAGRIARQTLWRGIASVVQHWRFRDGPRFKQHASLELAVFCAERISHEIGEHAARVVVLLVEAGAVSITEVRERLQAHMADASAEARELVARIVRLEGLPPPPVVTAPVEDATAARIRACTDLEQLARWCTDSQLAVVQEAALVLLARGEAGQLRLAQLLADLAALPHPLAILATVQLWDSPHALAAARALAADPALPPPHAFHLYLGLASHGDASALARAFAAARAPDRSWSLRPADWDALCRLAPPLDVALALAAAPHHHAYQPAVAILLPLAEPPAVADALCAFLEVDGDRPRYLRLAAARRLAEHWGDARALPLIAEHVCDEREELWHLAELPAAARAPLAEMVVAASLVGGHNACSEKRMWSVLEALRSLVPLAELAPLHARVFEQASTAVTRRAAAQLSVKAELTQGRLHRVADVFAWGVRRGVELAGRRFTIHLTGSEGELGHTRLDGNRIYVSPLPMLRDEAHGKDIVEGLVLHEIGHHVYHRGEAAQALWNQAHKEGLGHFLNLIADEHLERNLRAQDPAFGDRLKRLGAYAFQHAPQEIKVTILLDSLRASAAAALTATPLDVAFDEQAVRLRRGAVLAELDKVGHPVARFARALRMGLGNRHGDPLIADALARCKQIRAHDMQGLYDLTKQLAALFGGATELAKVFGGPEGLEFGERDGDVFGHGLDDDILQREVERILHPAESSRSGPRGPRDRLQINVNPDEDFQRITHIERIRGDAEAHRTAAAEVARHAARLRSHLDDLGLRWLPAHARTHGRALDRTRLRPLVTRLDPRILVAREPVRRTDLFLGTLVDCSGSMTAGDNIERARRFAILVAEAVRPLPGVEARFFGFTDSTIFDAGDARDCHVTGLETDGGNNDAAALWHAANIALASPQRAKVLVMISDGLPTECSVEALRALVTKLTRRKGIVCAQVAVRELEEVCFPHHVVLDDAELDVAVARFGRMIADLARRSLAS